MTYEEDSEEPIVSAFLPPVGNDSSLEGLDGCVRRVLSVPVVLGQDLLISREQLNYYGAQKAILEDSEASIRYQLGKGAADHAVVESHVSHEPFGVQLRGRLAVVNMEELRQEVRREITRAYEAGYRQGRKDGRGTWQI